MFMPSGPGVFRGDHSFHTRDDSPVSRLPMMDTRKAPVGAPIAIMEELGHFPMSENPKAFQPYFADALMRMPG
ncbi:hypothetical protein [Bradyrhizobium sp.]|uniref:hypothetical protein n=1 Tax=Bradyrhizobium sp. TaxID=376 RepID=UPI0025B8FD3C|nr:hypothetical protein [Bradyrhizobium sp.]